jgi:hypothetical protein
MSERGVHLLKIDGLSPKDILDVRQAPPAGAPGPEPSGGMPQ